MMILHDLLRLTNKLCDELEQRVKDGVMRFPGGNKENYADRYAACHSELETT